MDPVSKAQVENSQKPSRISRLKGYGWKKGQSGNPGGRPKKKPVTEIFEEILASTQDREAVKQQVKQTLTSKGMAGVLLLREAAERTEGKVAQPVEIDGQISLSLAETIQERRKRLGNGTAQP